jgi:hypothetical protein
MRVHGVRQEDCLTRVYIVSLIGKVNFEERYDKMKEFVMKMSGRSIF